MLPPDTNLYLDYSENLTYWFPIGSWVNGGAPIFLYGVSLNGNDGWFLWLAPPANFPGCLRQQSFV